MQHPKPAGLARANVAGKEPDDGLVDDVLDEALITEDGFDTLTGSSGGDWFIIGDGDKITDFKKIDKDGDLVTVL